MKWFLFAQAIVLALQIYLLRDTNRRVKLLNDALAERQKEDLEQL